LSYTRAASLTKFVENVEGFDAFGFAALMEKTMVGDNAPKFKTKKSFSPSGVGYGHGACPRYWHIAFSGAEFVENTDATGAMNMSNGSYVHDRLQKIITEALGSDVEMEVEINNEKPPIRGFVDVVATFQGKPVVGEIKSAKQEIFDGIASSGKPLPYHMVQLLMYLRVLGIKQGFFYYENKNTQQFVILPVNLNEYLEKYTDYLFDWMQTTADSFYVDKKVAKPISEKRKAKACTYCPVRDECLSRREGDVELPVLELP
jgi:CRISPR/Cas system-associated exonuclease Cas4 (RecB family)